MSGDGRKVRYHHAHRHAAAVPWQAAGRFSSQSKIKKSDTQFILIINLVRKSHGDFYSIHLSQNIRDSSSGKSQYMVVTI